ncbi:MAG: ABC transporter permease subunit [Lachnospiraceae bacterium]|jgi:ABC-2 type transport system permease protein|nr:ABC transporter permease subunit [Lachnospiraceae bacterium]
MTGNPIYKREMTVSSRSFRLALVLLVFNGILALVALLNMYSTLVQVRVTAEIQYTSFLDLYIFVAVLEFVMLIFIMPAITAGAISGERERQTLDLMLSTKMTAAQIVLGKLMAALSTMTVLIISSFPILALVFVYGGVTVKDIGMLLICYGAAALFVGSLGICCSAVFRKTTFSTVVSYTFVGIIVIGTYGINQLALFFSRVPGGAYLASASTEVASGSSGGFLYLLLLNPTTTFVMTMLRLAGREQISGRIVSWFGSHGESFISKNWVSCSVALQVLMAAMLIWAAVKAVTPGRK